MHRLALIATGALAACSGALDPLDRPDDPFAPPPPVGVCRAQTSDTPGATLMQGYDTLSEVGDATPAAQEFGSQGGSHLWLGVLTTGMPGPLDVKVEARDAYTGARLGRGEALAVAQGGGDGTTCSVRGVILFLNDRFDHGAGLADLRIDVRDERGVEAFDVRRAFIGEPQPACQPEGAIGLTPLHFPVSTSRRADAIELVEDAILDASPGDTLHLTAGLRGFAASAATLTASVFDGDERLARVSAEPSSTDAYQVPEPRSSGDDCVSPQTLLVPVRETLVDRPLTLVLEADDGLGHVLTTRRSFTLEAR